MIYGDVVKAAYGNVPRATNNYAETLAVLEALKMLRVPCRVNLVTDSTYVINGIYAAMRSKVLGSNSALWEQMLTMVNVHSIRPTHVDGHSTSFYNELADGLASRGSKLGLSGHFYIADVQEEIRSCDDPKEWSDHAKLFQKIEKRIAHRTASA